MFASKIGNIILADPLNMPDCAFACGVAMSGILEASKQNGLESPDNWQLDLVQQFVKGLSASTTVMMRSK